MRRLRLSLACALLCGLAGSARAAPSPEAQWTAYKQRFIQTEGRLADDSAKGVSHSEGQGYAMLLAAFAGDRPTFDKLWSWTQANLEIRGDGLAAWRWLPDDQPHVKDRNNATDGDLLIGWALAEAAQRWKDPAYREQAAAIARAVFAHATYPAIFGTALAPGVDGFGPKDGKDGPVVNLSYWVFPAFPALARVAPELDWAGLRESGVALLDSAKFGPRALPSDWISLKAGPQPAEAYPRRFGYDVVRAPLYLSWGAPAEKERLRTLVKAWAGASDAPPPVVDIATGAPKGVFGDKGYRAVLAYARCVAEGAPFPADLREVDLERYYPATLQMLALAAMRQGSSGC